MKLTRRPKSDRSTDQNTKEQRHVRTILESARTLLEQLKADPGNSNIRWDEAPENKLDGLKPPAWWCHRRAVGRIAGHDGKTIGIKCFFPDDINDSLIEWVSESLKNEGFCAENRRRLGCGCATFEVYSFRG